MPVGGDRDRPNMGRPVSPKAKKRPTLSEIVGGFQPKPTAKERFLARFTPQPSPDVRDRASSSRRANLARGAAPQGGPGTREIKRTLRSIKPEADDAVLRLQRELRASGFDVADDGVWGPQTEAAHKLHLSRLRAAVSGNIRGRQDVANEAVGRAFLTPGRAGSQILARQFGPGGFALDVERGAVHQRLGREYERKQSIKKFAEALQLRDRLAKEGYNIGPSTGDRVADAIGGFLNKHWMGGPDSDVRQGMARLGQRQMQWSMKPGRFTDWFMGGPNSQARRWTGSAGATIFDYLSTAEQQAPGHEQRAAIVPEGAIKGVAGFTGRLVGGVAASALALPGSALYGVSDPQGMAKELARSYAWQYGPLAEGDIGEFFARVNEAPAGPVMDLLAVATLGTGTAARAGMIPMRPGLRTLQAPAHPPIPLRAARTQLMRNVQAAYDALSEKHPGAPLIGSISRAARQIPGLRTLQRDEMYVYSAPFREALREFAAKHRLNPSRRHIDATAYDRRLRYGPAWKEGIQAEIVMRTQRVQEGVDRAEYQFQSGEIRRLRRIMETYGDELPPHVENLAREGVGLANATEAMKIRLGMFDEGTAEARKSLAWQIVADYRNIDHPHREALDWLVRNHYTDEYASAMMEALDGFMWAKAGGPKGDIDKAYGDFLQLIEGDPYALPSAIVLPPGVDDAAASQSILFSRDRALDLDMPDELDWTALEQALSPFELPPAMQQGAAHILQGVYDLARRGRIYRDWYVRAAEMAKAVERISGQSGEAVPAWKVAQLMAIYSQQATVQQNAMFALRAIKAWQRGEELPLGAGGQAQRAKARAILTGESYATKSKGKDGGLGVTNGEWDGIKTSSYAANILQHVDPERYRQVFGENHFVTVDRHVADMFDPSLGQNPGRYYEGIAQAILALSRQAGMTPSEFQAAAWVTWKAKKLMRENRTYTEERAWREAMDAYEIGVNQFADVPDEVAVSALSELRDRVSNDPDKQQLSLLDDTLQHPRSLEAQSRPLFEPKTFEQRYENILRKTAIYLGAKGKRGPTERQRRLAEDYLLDWSEQNPEHPLANRFQELHSRMLSERNAESDRKAAGLLYQRGEGSERARQAQQSIDATKGRDLDGLPTEVNIPRVGKIEWHSNREIQQLADEYMQRAGLSYLPPTRYVPVNPEKASAIAAAYDRMKHAPQDPMVQETYRAFIEETMAQYQALIEAGYKPEFYPEGADPYPNSPRESALDIIENKHMYVFPTEAGFGSGPGDFPNHPLMGVAEGVDWGGGKPVYYNDIFRFVHDVFGHVKEGVGFRADGEDNAWRSHAAMYSHKARNAMTAETRGQNSWVNYGPYGERNRTASQTETVYADQKAGLLPGWIQDDLDPPGPGGISSPAPGTIGEWEARRQFRGEMEDELGPSATDPLEGIPTLDRDTMGSQAFISDEYGPALGESIMDEAQAAGFDPSHPTNVEGGQLLGEVAAAIDKIDSRRAADALHKLVGEGDYRQARLAAELYGADEVLAALDRLEAFNRSTPGTTDMGAFEIALPPDAKYFTRGQALKIEADPRFVYHGTSDAAAEAIMGQRKIIAGGPLGGLGDVAWFADNPKLAAMHAGSRSHSAGETSGGSVIAVPRSALPQHTKTWEPDRNLESRYGGRTYSVEGQVLFQRGQKTKITAETVDTDVIRGAASFDPQQRLRVFLGKEADESTLPHELAHGLRRHLPEVVGPELWARVESEIAEAVGKPLQLGKWTEAHEEYFSRAATRWFREGKAPSPRLANAYAIISEALQDIYPVASQAGPAPGVALRQALHKGGNPFGRDPRTGEAYVPDWTRKTMRGSGPAGRGFPRETGRERKVQQNKGILFTRARHVSDPEVTLRDFERTTNVAFKLISIESLEKFAEPWDWESAPIREGYVPVIFRGKNPIPHIFQEEFEVIDRTPKEYEAMVRQAEGQQLARIFPDESQLREFADAEGADNIRVYQIPKKIRDAYLDRSVRIPAQALNDNAIVDAIDLTNSITKAAVVYAKLSYIPVNYSSNLILLGIDAGPFAPMALKRAMRRLSDLEADDLAWIDAQVGEGPAAALATERGRLSDMLRDLAAWQSRHADRIPRRAAWINAARRHGYSTIEEIRSLREERNADIRFQIGREAEDAMVRFRGLTPFERDVVSRLAFLYGWTRGASRFMWNYSTEKPLLADLTYHLGEEGAEWIQRQLGILPDYMRGLVPWGAKMKRRGVEVVPVRDLRALNPVSTGAEVLEAGANLVQGDPKRAGSQFSDYMSPAVKTPFELLTGYDTFFGRQRSNRWEAITGQVERWPMVQLGKELIDPTVDIADAYGKSTSRKSYLPPDSETEGRLDVLAYFVGGNVLRERDLNLKEANEAGERQRPELKLGWAEELQRDAAKLKVKMSPGLQRDAEAKARLDSDPRTDRGTSYTQKLEAAVEVFSGLYPQQAGLVRASAKRASSDEEQARRFYLRLRDLMFSRVNEFRGDLDDRLEAQP